MPAITAHYYFGQEVLKLLPKEIQNVIEKNKSSFDLGLQGPDILFYYKPFEKNEISKMGGDIHEQAGNLIISKAINKIKKTSNQEALVYLLGFSCHFALDCSVHGKISQITSAGIEHNLLEAELDRQVIEEFYSKEPNKFKRYNLVKIKTESFDWMQLIYPGITVKQLKKCARGFFFYSWLLYSKGNAKKTMLVLAEKSLHREGEFSSMMISGQKNERYSQPAKDIYKQMKGTIAFGAEAVINVYTCFKENGVLLEMFKKNFL